MKDKDLPVRIIDLREKRNMTQVELAKKLGVEKSTMSKIENGTRKVSSQELDMLANILGVSADYLLGREKNNSSQIADLADDNVIFTYEGKKIPPEDLEYMKRILRGGKA